MLTQRQFCALRRGRPSHHRVTIAVVHVVVGASSDGPPQISGQTLLGPALLKKLGTPLPSPPEDPRNRLRVTRRTVACKKFGTSGGKSRRSPMIGESRLMLDDSGEWKNASFLLKRALSFPLRRVILIERNGSR